MALAYGIGEGIKRQIDPCFEILPGSTWLRRVNLSWASWVRLKWWSGSNLSNLCKFVLSTLSQVRNMVPCFVGQNCRSLVELKNRYYFGDLTDYPKVPFRIFSVVRWWKKHDKCINLWNLNQFPHLWLLLCTNPNSKSWVLSTSTPKSRNNYVVIGFYPFPEGLFVWVWGHFPHPDGNAADGAWRKQKGCWFLGLQMKWEEGWWRCYLGGGKRIDDNGIHGSGQAVFIFVE